jgi:hypothetical protein
MKKLIAPMLAAGAAALAIAAAPLASAESAISQTCGETGGGTVCQSPGNVQVNATPAPAQYYPFGGNEILLGGNGFFGGGGFHGGGFGGGGFGGGHGGGHR